VRALAEQYYGPLEPTVGLEARARPQEPPQLVERRMTFADARIAQPYVTRSYLAPERDSGDQYEAAKLVMLAEILGGSGATSVLGQKLQFETKQAIFTSASYGGVSLDDTTFGLVIAPSPDFSLAQAEAALDQAVAEFIQEGVDPEQLARIKMQMRASQIYAQDNIESLAQRYGAGLTSGLTIEDIEAWPDILQSVTGEDIIEAARVIFDKRNAVTGWAMPADAEEASQ
ncbi:MAG: M16 family metallopeptidase, partial [Paracoccaceae bacterium]